ncbi:MAG: hypothetical protein RMK35_03690, partial [Aquificaceae bacterium]|nr:hypothetical protein [Aquificaceae bacterium]
HGLETQPFREFLAKELSIEAFYSALIRACDALEQSTKERVSSYISERFSWEATFVRLLEVYSQFLLRVIS